MKGIIKSVVRNKNYGFIKNEHNGVEYFFHKDDYYGHWDDLVIDFEKKEDFIKVTFEPNRTEKGPRASEVKRLDFPN